jgi:hypothetical protein
MSSQAMGLRRQHGARFHQGPQHQGEPGGMHDHCNGHENSGDERDEEHDPGCQRQALADEG